MTVGELRAALANPMIEDRHEVYVRSSVMGAKFEVVDAMVGSQPSKARVFVIVAEQLSIRTGGSDEFDEEENP